MEKKKTRFLNIYLSFSESEKKEFNEFISLSLFSKGRNYKDFLNSLKVNENGILKTNDPKKERTLSNRLSELTTLAEKFLAIKNLETNKFSFELLLLNELKKRNTKPFFTQRLNALIKSTSSRSISLNKVNELFEINSLYLKNPKEMKMSKKTIETFRYSFDHRFIQFVIENLDYMIHEFYFKRTNTSYSNTHRKAISDMLDLDFILSYFKKNLAEYYPLVSFYNYIYKAFLNTDDTYNYYVARKILTNELKNVSKECRSALYGHMIEYNITKLNDTKLTASKEMFYLVNAKLKEGMLEEEIKNDVHNSSFISYTFNALALGRFKWAENFIQRFGKILPEEYRDNGIYMSKAFLEYYKNNFSACKENVDKVKKINPYYYINASRLNLQSCFELNKFDECYTVLKRLQEYVRIQKSAGEMQIKYTQDFCSCYVLLLKLRENPTDKNLLKLEFDLNKGNPSGRKWIERKMKEIRI